MGSASRKRWAQVSFQVEIRVLSCLFFLLILCLYPSDFFHTGSVSASELSSRITGSDPHDAVQCYRCHSLETKEQAFDKERVKYDVDALCMECHDSFCMHPVGISTDRSKPESVEMDLPLVERAGDF